MNALHLNYKDFVVIQAGLHDYILLQKSFIVVVFMNFSSYK